MIDFHSHTYFSDGCLGPAEHVRRAMVKGYTVIGITDHVDFSNIEFVFTSVMKMVRELKDCGWDIQVIPGIEITHVPAKKIGKITEQAREMGIPLVIVHGESPVEPVEPGTNRAAIEAGVDILAHPGLIVAEDVKLAVDKGVALELTARKGHSITNGHVARLAMDYGADLVLDSDAHGPGDFLTPEFRSTVIKGSGLHGKFLDTLEGNIISLSQKFLKRRDTVFNK